MALQLLHCSHEDLSSDPSTHITSQGSLDCSPNSKTGVEGDRGHPIIEGDTQHSLLDCAPAPTGVHTGHIECVCVSHESQASLKLIIN